MVLVRLEQDRPSGNDYLDPRVYPLAAPFRPEIDPRETEIDPR